MHIYYLQLYELFTVDVKIRCGIIANETFTTLHGPNDKGVCNNR